MNRKLKLSAVCSEEAYEWLQRWIIEQHPKFPYPMKPEKYFYSKTSHREYLSKFIESVIVLVLRSYGGDPIKAPDKGKRIDKTEVTTNVLGHQKVNTRSIFVRDKSVRKGRSDVVCFFKGKMYNFEVKVGQDRQSPEQIKEQNRAEWNGEIYAIIKTVDDFLNIAID